MKNKVTEKFANAAVFCARMVVLFSLITSQFFGAAIQPALAVVNVDVGIVLPTEGGRWLEDKARLENALTAAGFTSQVLFSQDDIPTEAANITTLLAKNIKVLIICPVDSAATAAAVTAARAAKPNLKIITYDRLITDTNALDFYVTFDNNSVGETMGQYLVGHAGVGSGKPLYLYAGSATDNNAFQFFEGAWTVLQPKISDGTFVIQNSSAAVGLKNKLTLTRSEQEAIFAQISIANWDPNNAGNLATANLMTGDKGNVFILAPNDGTGRSIADVFAADNGVTSYMITGQDAEWNSIQYIIDGKQTMTVFKDIRTLADDAAAVANTFLTGATPAYTTIYNNGTIDVHADPTAVVTVDKTNVKTAIIDSGYYGCDFASLDPLCQFIEASAQNNWVNARKWPTGTVLKLKIDDLSNGLGGVDYSTTATMEQAPWNPGDPNDIVASFDLGSFTLAAGDVVSVSQDIAVPPVTKSLVLSAQHVTSFNVVTDTVSGVATAGANIDVCLNIPNNCIFHSITTAAIGGTWTLDYTPEHDLVPGDSGWVAEYDADSDKTWYDWYIPNPNIQVRANDDGVEGWEWPVGSTVTILVSRSGQSITRTATVVAASPWGDNRPYFSFDFKGLFDIKVGDTVKVTQGTTIRTTTVKKLAFTNVNLDADTVTGIASAGANVDVWICSNSDCNYNRHVKANVTTGVWSVDFHNAGTQSDEQTTVDIVPGIWIDSSEYDTNGNGTLYGVTLPNPFVEASIWGNWVRARGWHTGTSVTMEIDDLTNGLGGVDYTKTAIMGPAPWNPDDPNDIVADFDMSGFTLGVGDVVTVVGDIDGSSATKTLTISGLRVLSFDVGTNTVSGVAAPGKQVEVCVNVPNNCISRLVTADSGDGTWTVNYSPEYDLKLGDNGWAAEYDADSDRNWFDWKVLQPSFDAWFEQDIVRAYHWELGEELTLTIEDPATTPSPDYTTTRTVEVSPWDPSDTQANFDLNGSFNFSPGMTIMVSGDTVTKLLQVVDLSVDKINLANNTVAGTTGANQAMWIWYPDSCCRVFQSNASGEWVVNFSAPGPDGESIADIVPGSSGTANAVDADDDNTSLDWTAPDYPAVQSSLRSSPEETTSASSVEFAITFSRAVTDVDKADFKLTTTAITGAFVTGVSGSGAGPYTVTVNTGTGNGTIRLGVLGTASIYDSAGNAVLMYIGGEAYTISKGAAPTVPVLKLPANNAIVADFKPKLDWNDSSEVLALTELGWHYEVNVTSPQGYNQTFNTVDDADPLKGLGESEYTFETNLPENTTFTWKVRAYNDKNQYSAWSVSRTFLTKAASVVGALPTPGLTSPADLSTENSRRPTFEWGAVSGATSYTLQILKENPTTHLFTVVAVTGTIKAPFHTYTPTTDLLPSTEYKWQVKATNGTISSGYSSQRIFMTSGNPPKVPVLALPANSALVDSTAIQTLKWNPVPGVTTTSSATTYPVAKSFQVEYAANSAFDNSIIKTVNDVDPSDKLQLSQTIDGLLPNSTYYWHVRSWSDTDADGSHSIWSAARSFRTKLAKPELNLPANSSLLDNKRPTFSWDEVPGATTYTLQVLKKNPATGLFTVVAHTGTIKAPAYVYTPTVDLLPDTDYKWQVKANGTNAGDYSAQFIFTTSADNPPKAPILSAPANNTLVDSVAPQTLKWAPVQAVTTTSSATTYPAATSYEVEYATNAAFINSTVVPVTTTELNIGTLLPGRTYYWHVRSVSGAGNHSAWSATWMIKVKFAKPTLTSPDDGKTGIDARPTFTWDSAGNGLWTNYTLQVANNSAFTSELRSFTITAPTTTYTIPSTLPGLTSGTKYWRVRVNGLYAPIFSDTRTFTPMVGTLKVWSFTNEIRTMAIAFHDKYPDVKVEYTMIPMTNGEYQTKVMTAAGTANAPDVVGLEAAFVKEWVESPVLLANQNDLLSLTQDLQTYPSVVDVGTNAGVTKAFSYQATPGAFFYRRSIATQCLGTDNPAAVQAMVSDMTKFVATADIIKACGTGDYFTVGSSTELLNPFLSNRAQPWVVNGTLVIDPKVDEYVQFAKLMRDNGYESGASQWTEDWFAGMNDTLKDGGGTPKKIFGYFLPTWGLPYVLIPNAKSVDGVNDTTGDWAMISGPLSYQWGGTWVGALQGGKNAGLAKEFIKFVALDEENLTNWATGVYTNQYLKAIDPTTPDDVFQPAGDFVSSQLVVDKITASFDNSSLADFLGGENPYGAFAAAAPSVNGELMQGSDDVIQRTLTDPLYAYLDGTKTEAQMWQAWLDAVAVEFPDLVLPVLP